MNRPLMQHGVGQLEQLFAASKADAKVLKQLENELRYRQVPRAVALLAEVQSALYSQPAKESSPLSTGGKTDAPPKSEILRPPPVQPPLWTLPANSSGETPKKQPELSRAPGKSAGQPFPSVLSPASAPASATGRKPASQREPSPAPMVTLTEAYNLFKATSTSSWESIEQVRRLAVQASSPTRLTALAESQRISVREEAQKFNAAYEVLSRARLSSQAGS